MNHQFVIFRDLFEDEVIKRFYKLIKHPSETRYAKFVSALYQKDTIDWTQYLTDCILSLENCMTRIASSGKDVPELMIQSAKHELSILSSYARMKPDDFFEGMHALWQSHEVDLETIYFERLSHIDQYGFGDFARYTMFQIQESTDHDFCLEPVKYPDPIRLSDLIGYDLQKQKIIANTEVLLNDHLASNVLLYGDAGTGKSATVKAIANEYYDRGLRIIEVYKHQFQDLNTVISQIKNRNYKFIIYMDDLSFEEFEIEYKYLKAVIEGGLEKKPDNVLIYATSNRRHLIRETFSDKEEVREDMHTSDTVQEKLSLYARFGVSIYFGAPSKKEFQHIVVSLAEKNGITMDEETLLAEANKWELAHGGLSGRTAQQFINYLLGKQE
mgnify:CR=1 FL=1